MVEPPALPAGVTLQVWRPGASGLTLEFEDRGKWLHPLFELSIHLEGHPVEPPADLVLRDRIIGRAAAFLILRLGIRQAWTDLGSQRARALFDQRGLVLHAHRWVEKVDCMTEDLLAEVEDQEVAWEILSQRRKAALSRP